METSHEAESVDTTVLSMFATDLNDCKTLETASVEKSVFCTAANVVMETTAPRTIAVFISIYEFI